MRSGNLAMMQSLALDDCEIGYYDQGVGEPLLLVHAGVSSDWFLLMAASPLLNGFRIVRVCRAGYGRNAPKRSLTIEDHASHIAALAGRLGLKKFHIVGHSFSGLIGMQLASDRPDSIQSLILLEPAACGPLQAPAFAELAERFVKPAMEAFAAGNLESAFDIFMQGFCGKAHRSAFEDSLGKAGYDRAVRQSRFFFQDEIPAAMQWQFGPLEASRIQQPVLIVEGSESLKEGPMSRQVTELAMKILPSPEVAIVDGVNHAMPLQKPDEVAKVVADFARRHPMR